MATRKKKNNIGAFGHPIYGKGFAKYGEMRTNGSSEIPNDLEEAAKKFVGYDMDCDEQRDYEIGIAAFIAGAKWHRSQMLKEARNHFVLRVLSDNTIKKMIELYNDEVDCKFGDVVRIIIVKE